MTRVNVKHELQTGTNSLLVDSLTDIHQNRLRNLQEKRICADNFTFLHSSSSSSSSSRNVVLQSVSSNNHTGPTSPSADPNNNNRMAQVAIRVPIIKSLV